jgi:23S rRNA (uracil1939-C5)-methyltransferase
VGRSNRLIAEMQLDIQDMSHDGRGVARREDGKAVFVSGALPGETVIAKQTARNRHFDEAQTLQVLQASELRIAPKCQHFGVCSGCVLQHLEHRVLKENLQRIGHVEPQYWLEPLSGDAWGYRRKGRLSVRWVAKKGKVLVGFRELDARFVADIQHCHTLVPQIGSKIEVIRLLVESLEAKETIPQIEFIAGDQHIALVFRHLQPLSEADLQKLREFARIEQFAVFLQPKGVESVHALEPLEVDLSFVLPDYDVRLHFKPLDFIQVNASLNQKMIAQAIAMLEPQPSDRILDLFCGLGNFTLPLARSGAEVVGVEGDAGLVQRARENAQKNGISNVSFYAADLTQDQSSEPWFKAGFNKLLLDPPRAGAIEVLTQLPLKNIQRIVYVSCHPGSLARDAGFLVNERGFKLVKAGAMDMFPHTAHVESIALFER